MKIKLQDAHRFDDAAGNQIQVLNCDYTEHGPLPEHFMAALFRWQSALDDRGIARADHFARDLSALTGARDKWHLFNVEASDPGGFYLEHRARIGAYYNEHRVEHLPLALWPFPAQIRAHSLSLQTVRAEALAPQLSLISRVFGESPQAYLRLLCPLSEDGRHVTHVASFVELQGPRILESLP